LEEIIHGVRNISTTISPIFSRNALSLITKPTLKDGELDKLYITSASVLEDPEDDRELVSVTL
jgi:hypothetical protein